MTKPLRATLPPFTIPEEFIAWSLADPVSRGPVLRACARYLVARALGSGRSAEPPARDGSLRYLGAKVAVHVPEAPARRRGQKSSPPAIEVPRLSGEGMNPRFRVIPSDVTVVALPKAPARELADVLDPGTWHFLVLSTTTVVAAVDPKRRITLTRLRRLAPEVKYQDLASEVHTTLDWEIDIPF